MTKKHLAIIAVTIGIVIVGVGVFFWLNSLKPQDQARQDGAGLPKPPAPSHIDATLDKMTLRQKIASLLVLHTSGTDEEKLRSYASAYKLGGLILMGDNIPNDDGVLRSETSAIRGDDRQLPRLVATDQEGGTVRRLMGDNFASALTLKDQPVSATTQAFEQRSLMVQSVGITLNFGIIADVTDNPASFIYDRVLGTTPEAAAERVVAAVKASQGKTLTTLKHFPGHGETTADSHVSIPTTDISYEAWQTKDALPFKAGIEAGADVIMMGHLRYASVDSEPASLSKKWHEILRNDLGFGGVIITDAMGMLQNSGETAYSDWVKNSIKAIQAGTTLLLFVTGDPGNAGGSDPDILIDGIHQAAKDGSISEKQIDEAARKSMELRSKSASLVKQ